jgi:hypothetical protein
VKYSYYTERYTELIKNADFEKRFMTFLEGLISNVKKENKKTINVDKMITQFIDDYIKESRKEKIEIILRKKDI